MNMEELRRSLEVEEGVLYKVYLDPLGLKTCGIGHLCLEGEPEFDMEPDEPVSAERVEALFEKDMKTAIGDARQIVSGFDDLPDEVQLVLVEMAFNLGAPRLSKFKRMIRHVNERRFADAAVEMMDSKWARQLPGRARRLSDRMAAN